MRLRTKTVISSIPLTLCNGTKVAIHIPAVMSKVEPQPAPLKAETGAGRILIMDDKEFILDVTGDVLRELGYDVEVSIDGLEALNKYEAAINEGKRFDAVIMDLTIPGGMGGKEAISFLLEIDQNAKAIVSSGYSNDPVMANFRDYGFVGVVPKPYKIEELSHTLKEVLRK
jgi:CheY-like chemotaxis protein